MYQYRVILPYDDKMVNVATDMDFNVEGEAKFPLAEKVVSTLSFAVLFSLSNDPLSTCVI